MKEEDKIINIPQLNYDNLIRIWQAKRADGAQIWEMTKTGGWKLIEQRMLKFINEIKNDIFENKDVKGDLYVAQAFQKILDTIKVELKNYENSDNAIKKLKKLKE
jgi:hypothetical protein